MEQEYLAQLAALETPSFQNIRRLATNQIQSFDSKSRDELYAQLDRGQALLINHGQMCQYLYSYGNMHEAKLNRALSHVPQDFWKQDFEIIDWGCGQGIGTLKVHDILREKDLAENVKKNTLIEPSLIALSRAEAHLKAVTSNDRISTIGSFFEDIDPASLRSPQNRPRLHIFSNILDVPDIDLKKLAQILDESCTAQDIILAISPIYGNSHRVDAFLNYFDEEKVSLTYQENETNLNDREWTYLGRICLLNSGFAQHVKSIQYFPAVHYAAAYALDMVFNRPKVKEHISNTAWRNFSVTAPFDLGATVYTDTHPVFAVLHNMLVRGLPTKASPFIEDKVAEGFGLTAKELVHGTISYPWTGDGLLESELNGLLNASNIDVTAVTDSKEQLLQLVFSPIAIARFQKVMLEAILTERLDLKQDNWEILVEELDVPFAALAVVDLKQQFDNLVALTSQYRDLKLPKITLSIIGSTIFRNSPLHLGGNIFTSRSEISRRQFDLIVSQSVFKSEDASMDNFDAFQAINDCYFHIRSTTATRVNRTIYTTDLIQYDALISRDEVGNYQDIEEQKEHLTYFLNSLFRKESFRPGQLPILNRALQQKPVIGLLPTGGGKSLTYQMASMLQPGITMVVDPLKSLMKDQYEGLIRVGIDSATYLNSSLSSEEKKRRELALESSQIQFMFLSPERLGIANFRDRLQNMWERDAYFSYGVIDEVHCVSEWGHDFRFNYLHLGRNLYNYVKPKNGVISLFGLTATASFDVLADVERELSGHGAFTLDSDTIVRYENTNRLELQYKIETVPIEFEEDSFYDPNQQMNPSLPKAVNIRKTGPAHKSKSKYLAGLLPQVQNDLEELQRPESIELIKQRFSERQNIQEIPNQTLNTDSILVFNEASETYDKAGIVFCPHVNTTGISVNYNASNLGNRGYQNIASYSGKDNDTQAELNLDKFRENKSPLMIATKAFGMGIDKPNVRFTVNMAYSSSLEAFVQEAGRAGRDQKMAVSYILFADYKLAQVSRSYTNGAFPIPVIRNKWFKEEDLNRILNYYKLNIPEEFILRADPKKDIVQLYCPKDHQMFSFGHCDTSCSEFGRCQLRKVNASSRGWKLESDLVEELRNQGLSIGRTKFKYLSPDFETNMYFFGMSFKGDLVEKSYMVNLMNTFPVYLEGSELAYKGFLSILTDSEIDKPLFVYVNYIPDEEVVAPDVDPLSVNRQSDLSKAIYRMTCIGLIEDFTQDYKHQTFRIKVRNKPSGSYYEGLQVFLEKYYSKERAIRQIQEVKSIVLNHEPDNPVVAEIYRCLSFLTQFVYDKISEKRKRAIDDIRNFCLEGTESENWLEANEEMKDFIYYYFNSKYARTDYIAQNGENFSLVLDTDEGRVAHVETIIKYLRVVDDEDPANGNETPLDNIKHLYGATRLIGRGLTDSNPVITLLECFCLAYLGFRNNEALKQEFKSKFIEGMQDLSERDESEDGFNMVLEAFKSQLSQILEEEFVNDLFQGILLYIHARSLKTITNNYLS